MLYYYEEIKKNLFDKNVFIKVVTIGLTGHIEFDDNGFRKGYELEILELLYFGDNVAHSIETVQKCSQSHQNQFHFWIITEI